jgi:hypothetical protein
MSGDGLLSTNAFSSNRSFPLTRVPVRLFQFPAQCKACFSALSSSYSLGKSPTRTSQSSFLWSLWTNNIIRQDWWRLGRTGGAVCKVSYSLARANGRSWVQAPAAFLARLGNKYLVKSLMMSTLHSASVLDKPL